MRVRWTTDAADDLERSSTVASVHARRVRHDVLGDVFAVVGDDLGPSVRIPGGTKRSRLPRAVLMTLTRLSAVARAAGISARTSQSREAWER